MTVGLLAGAGTFLHVTDGYVLVSGSSHPTLGRALSAELGLALVETDVAHFPSGELHVRIPSSVRDRDVILLQTHTRPVNDLLMETFLTLDALRRASARSVTLLAPFFPYARQDRKGPSREPISASVVASLLESLGVSRLVSLDLHASQIQGFFSGPVEHLSAFRVFSNRLAEVSSDLVVVSPDAGRVKLAERYSDSLGAPLAIVHKRRDGEKVRSFEVVGDVRGRSCVIVDDMIDTASTLASAASVLLERGAREVLAAATHGVFSPPAFERLEGTFSKVLVSDSLPQDPPAFVEVLESSRVLAPALSALMRGQSIPSDLGGSL